jgi:hypothetical protein
LIVSSVRFAPRIASTVYGLGGGGGGATTGGGGAWTTTTGRGRGAARSAAGSRAARRWSEQIGRSRGSRGRRLLIERIAQREHQRAFARRQHHARGIFRRQQQVTTDVGIGSPFLDLSWS